MYDALDYLNLYLAKKVEKNRLQVFSKHILKKINEHI